MRERAPLSRTTLCFFSFSCLRAHCHTGAGAYHRVGVLAQSAHGQQAVVRLHDDVAGVLRVREDRVRLDQLLGEAVVEALEQEGSQTGTGTTGDGVQQHEALKRVAAVGLAVDHVHDLLLHRFAHGIAGSPVVARARAILVDVEVLRVVDVLVGSA